MMVVDDDEPTRLTLRELLLEQGIEVLLAQDGLEALAKLRTSRRPQLILLDMRMPRLDGYLTLKALKEDPALAPIPVLVLSGAIEDWPDDDELAAGFLPKPFPLKRLLDVVGMYCRASLPLEGDPRPVEPERSPTL